MLVCPNNIYLEFYP